MHLNVIIRVKLLPDCSRKIEYMENYYKNQLKRVKNNEYVITIKLSDSEGNSTNNIDLNLKSIPVLIHYLNELLLDEQLKKLEE